MAEPLPPSVPALRAPAQNAHFLRAAVLARHLTCCPSPFTVTFREPGASSGKTRQKGTGRMWVFCCHSSSFSHFLLLPARQHGARRGWRCRRSAAFVGCEALEGKAQEPVVILASAFCSQTRFFAELHSVPEGGRCWRWTCVGRVAQPGGEREDPPPQAWKLATRARESSGRSVTWRSRAGRPQQRQTAA